LTLTLDRVEVILVCICGQGLPTHEIRWKSEKLFVDVRTDVRTYGRTHLSSNLLGHRWGDDLKIIIVALIKAYCLPILLYASEAVSLSGSNVQILNNCISRALCKTFGISDLKSLQTACEAVGLQDIKILIERRLERFVDKLITNDKYRNMLLCSSCL